MVAHGEDVGRGRAGWWSVMRTGSEHRDEGKGCNAVMVSEVFSGMDQWLSPIIHLRGVLKDDSTDGTRLLTKEQTSPADGVQVFGQTVTTFRNPRC